MERTGQRAKVSRRILVTALEQWRWDEIYLLWISGWLSLEWARSSRVKATGS
jgi:hypothetical protein